jgi:antitoxin VapB
MNELDAKRSRLLTWLADSKLEAVYLTRVSNFAWLTGGLEPVVMLSSDRAEAGLLITPQRSYVVCNTIEHPRLRDEDRLEDQGYAFHASPWYHGLPEFDSLVRGRRWAADWPLPSGSDCAAEIARLRFQLLPEEVDRYRRLGRATGMALERAARQVRPGMSEMEIAGRIAAEAMHEGVTPTMLLVGADERIFRYRHPIPTSRAVDKYALLAICARRWGLVTSATRLVHFGQLDPELQQKQEACAFVDATFNLSTVVGAAVSDVFHKAAMAYADAGFPDEWKRHNQGGSAGYESRDYEGTPTCPEHVLEEQGFAWNPSITGVKSEDTIIVHADGPEFLTTTGDWPTVHVTVGNQHLDRTAILTC